MLTPFLSSLLKLIGLRSYENLFPPNNITTRITLNVIYQIEKPN